jgi:pimeloyl-ACP methyl ester carboxylesterase
VQVGDDRGSHPAKLDDRRYAAEPGDNDWLRGQSGYTFAPMNFSEERLAPANGIELAYQEMGDPEGEPLLLVMGLAMQMLGWDEDFCVLLAERGFRVIRFDNRDIGHSTMIDEAGMPARLDMLRGRRSTAPYLLTDMAKDAFGLMDHLEIESAHVVGASMGGMIAQTMAIQGPERVRSLVSVMSTTGNRWIGSPTLRAWRVLLARFPRNRDEYIARAFRAFGTLGSPGFPMDRKRLAELAGGMYDRSHNPAGIVRQMHAISASGDRTAALRRLDLPTTVVHGDSDPLIRPAAGRATARAIPGARLRMIEGMGHDLPRAVWPTFVEEIAATAAQAGWQAPAKQLV